MIQNVQKPYEFLVRWTDGVISGAHVGFVEQLIDDGKVLSQTPLPVQPVSLAGETGFPLATVLGQLQIDALAAMEAAKESEAKAKTAEADAKAMLSSVQDALLKANQRIAELEAQPA